MRPAPSAPPPPVPAADAPVPAADAPAPGRAWPAALAVALALAVFFAPVLLGAGDFVHRDTGRMHAPIKRWIGEELAAGRLPEWNPYAGLGTPVVANGIDALQHPFTALLPLLPPALAVKAWVLLSFAAAAAGAFAWARAAGRSAGGAAVAGIAFALSGPLVSSSDNLQYLTTYAALPWVLAAVHVHAARGGPAALLGVAAAGAACAAAGDPQAWGLAAALAPAYAVAVAAPGARGVALRRGLAGTAAIAIASAPFVLPVLAWLPHSERAGGLVPADVVRWNLHPRRLPELVIPDLLRADPADPLSPVFRAYAGNAVTPLPWFLSIYVGAAVVALAGAGARCGRTARRLAVAAAVFAWAALGPAGGFRALAAHLPVLSGFRYGEKLAVWIPLLLALAAAEGFDALLRRDGARALARGALAGGAALLAVAAAGALAPAAIAGWAGGPAEAGLGLAANLASGAARAGVVLVLLAAVAELLGRGRLGRAAPAAVALVVAVDLIGGNAGAYVLGPPEQPGRPPLAAGLAPGARILTPFEAREDRWPELGRVASTWEWSRRVLAACWNVPLRVGNERDYVGLREPRWARLRAAVEGGQELSRLGLFGFTHVVVPGRLELAARVGVPPPVRAVAADAGLPAWLVELPHRPRAYLAAAVAAASAAEAEAFAARGGTAAGTVVEGPVPAELAAAGDGPAGDATIVTDLPGDTRLEVTATRSALLVLNDAFAPGWSATVDGRPAEIVRTNALVRGVWVAPGRHEVRFRYRTPGLRLGWAVALAGAAALGGWALSRRRGRTSASPATASSARPGA